MVDVALQMAPLDDRVPAPDLEERLRIAQRAGRIGFWEWNLVTGETYWSDELRELLGFPLDYPAEFAAFHDIILEEDRERAIANTRAAIEQTGRIDQSFRVRRHSDGTIIWLASRADVIYDASHRAVRIVGVNADVSELRAARAALEESEQRFQIMADNVPVMLWISDEEGRCSFVNRACLNYFGKTLDDLAGFGWVPDVHPDDQDSYMGHFLACVDARRAFTMECRFRHVSGEFRWMRCDGAPRFHPTTGEYLGHVGSCLDVTDARRAADARELMMRELNHRVFNLLAIVQAVATQTAKSAPDLPGFTEAFTARIQALAAANRLLTQDGMRGTDLRKLIETELLPYAVGDRFVLDGEPVGLEPDTAVRLGMALHELATNAVKHGCLAAPTGRIAISWRVEERRLHVLWAERGGPPAVAPARQGFGSRLIRQVVQSDLGGTVEKRFEAEGLTCQLQLPLRFGPDPAAEDPAGETPAGSSSSRQSVRRC